MSTRYLEIAVPATADQVGRHGGEGQLAGGHMGRHLASSRTGSRTDPAVGQRRAGVCRVAERPSAFLNAGVCPEMTRRACVLSEGRLPVESVLSFDPLRLSFCSPVST